VRYCSQRAQDIWVRDKLLWTRSWTFRFHKMIIYWVTGQLLVSLKGFSSTELVEIPKILVVLPSPYQWMPWHTLYPEMWSHAVRYKHTDVSEESTVSNANANVDHAI
jgi:hypothetical protein